MNWLNSHNSTVWTLTVTKQKKIIVLGSLSKESVVLLTVSSTTVERVPVYKIFGVMVNIYILI